MKQIKEVFQFESERFLQHAYVLVLLQYFTGKKKLMKEAAAVLEDFGIPYSVKLCRNMVWNYYAHSMELEECLLYDCYHHTYAENENFIGNRETWYWAWKMNDRRQALILNDKYISWQYFKKFYGREIVRGVHEDDRMAFVDFVLAHGRIFIKPIDEGSGKGAQILGADTEKKANALFNYLRIIHPRGFVAEEIIMQCKEIAEFHPESVNTVRMSTIRHDGYVRIWHPFFRIGQGKSIVDNAGQGGIEVTIDPKTGILGNGADMHGRTYSRHPDTGKQIKGYRLPRWEEAVSLAEEIAQILPDARYIGWDFALTDAGWIVVEGNGTALMAQNIDREGFKEEYKRELRMIRQNR